MDDSIYQQEPFSLVCEQCDAGSDVDSFKKALELGWTHIVHAPDLPMANFVGVCPDCHALTE